MSNRRTCFVNECTAFVHGHGLCAKHYSRVLNHGTPEDRPPLQGRPKIRGNCATHPERAAVIRDQCRNCYARWLRNREGGPPCSIEACPRSVYSKSLCGIHYGRLRRTGTTEFVRPTMEERFWAKVDKKGPDECWEWTGARDYHGYGQFGASGDTSWSHVAHRISYEIAHGKGSIPTGRKHHVDHLCRNPPCVNPAHLEAVPARENTRRAWQRILADEDGGQR